MAKVQAFDTEGKDAGTVDLPEAVFGMTPHTAVMHEVLLAQLAARRAGTHSTKTRGEVRGSTRKIYRQKGTGRARHGSRKAPIFKGGGVIFGPKPRDYAQDTPRKIRRLAVRSALSAKAKDGRVIVVEPPELQTPRARVIAELLDRLPVAGKTLWVLPAVDALIGRSAGNVRGITVRTAASVSLRDVLDADYLVFTRPALAAVAEVFGR